MNIQYQCCTRDQALRLVALGVKPVATFYHMPAKDGPHGEYVQYGWHSDALAPAYNVAELGDMLPEVDTVKKMAPADWWAMLGNGKIDIDNPTEAQARAAMLIHLLENNLMKLPAHWRQDPNDPCADGRCQRGYSPGLQEIQPLPVPTYQEAETPAFKAAWQVMKDWTIQAPDYYLGSMEARGGHVKLLVDAVKGADNKTDQK